MQCPKCNESISSADISTVEAAHDPQSLDIIITCPNDDCGVRFNTFVSISEMMELWD